MANEVRGSGGKYDCIVPVSGGRDSSYVLWYAREILDLNILAVNGDNQFRSSLAAENLRNITQAADVDFVSLAPTRDLGRRMTQNRIRMGMRYGLDGMGPRGLLAANFCHACSVIVRSAIYSQAEKYRVPLILRGDSSSEKVLFRVVSQLRLPGGVLDRFGRAMSWSFIRDRYYDFLLRGDYPVSGNSRFRRGKPVLRDPEIKEVSVFDYLQWDREGILDTISSDLNWSSPEGSKSSWRFDCRLHDLVDFCYLRSFGCTHNCVGYTNMINQGQLTREQALELEKERVRELPSRVRQLLREMGFGDGEIEAVISLERDGRP